MTERAPRFDPTPFYNAPVLDIGTEAFNDLVVQRGIVCELRRAMPCPCAYGDTGQPRIDCLDCNGMGLVYPAALREPIRAIVQGRTRNLKLHAAGHGADDTAQITLQAGVTPAAGDQVWPEGETIVHHERIRRFIQEADPAALYHAAPNKDSTPEPYPAIPDRIRYPDVLGVEAVMYRHEGRSIVAHEGVDYRREGNLIYWLGAGPAPGDFFSVRYTAPAAYQITTVPGATRAFEGQTTPLPMKVTAIGLHKLAPADLR